MPFKHLILALSLFLTSFTSSFAQLDDVRIRAVYIYSFTRYIHWEEATDKPFHIQILGDQALYLELLNAMKSKMAAGRPIEVSYIENISQVTPSNILYLCPKSSSNGGQIKDMLIANNTLLVTCDQQKAGVYTHINFVTVNGKVHFEIDKEQIQLVKVKVSLGTDSEYFVQEFRGE